MDTVCVIMMATSICMVDEMMKMDASVLWYPMILVSSGMVCFVGCIMVPARLATNPSFLLSSGQREVGFSHSHMCLFLQRLLCG